MPAVYQRKDAVVLRCRCLLHALDVECVEQGDLAAMDPHPVAEHARSCGPVRIIPEREVSPMILERLTAWTLVIVYYTVTCGAILLGLRGAL
jgi:hypothetical protein